MHKKRPLKKTMTIFTTTGRLVYSNSYWRGKDNDSRILEDIFSKPSDNKAESLMTLINSHSKVVLTLDRGFQDFISWLDKQKSEEHRFTNITAYNKQFSSAVQAAKK